MVLHNRKQKSKRVYEQKDMHKDILLKSMTMTYCARRRKLSALNLDGRLNHSFVQCHVFVVEL